MQYLMSFILAMVLTMAWVPVFVRLGYRWLIVDRPAARKVHTAPIPRVGGIAMAIGVFVAAALTIHLQAQDRWFLLGGGVLVAFGALDDRFDLDYRIKLLGQIIAVSIVVALGDVQIFTITLDDRISLPSWISMPLTVVFLIGITNAINLADGLDGLAGGTTFLCLCAVALLSSIGDPGAITALALAFAGAVLGFLRFNTYPASVFMGDAGSQLLGFAIGVLSIRATQGALTQVSAALPVLLLAVPILDTLSVMVQRMSEGRSPFSPDRNHIHHKLLALGFDHHEAVMAIYGVQAALFVVAYFLRYESDLVIMAVVTTFFVISIATFQWASRSGWRLRRAHDPGSPPSPGFLAFIEKPRFLPLLSYLVLAGSLGVYAALIVGAAVVSNEDVRILIMALFAVLVGFLFVMRVAPLNIVEKGVLFVTATILVYLDTVVLPQNSFLALVGWGAIGIAAIASAVRLRLFNDRRFQLTPLDVIVLFMALVVPSLLGNMQIPHGASLAIVKLLVLLYGIEMLVSRTDGRDLWVRIAAASVLAGLAVRSLVFL